MTSTMFVPSQTATIPDAITGQTVQIGTISESTQFGIAFEKANAVLTAENGLDVLLQDEVMQTAEVTKDDTADTALMAEFAAVPAPMPVGMRELEKTTLLLKKENIESTQAENTDLSEKKTSTVNNYSVDQQEDPQAVHNETSALEVNMGQPKALLKQGVEAQKSETRAVIQAQRGARDGQTNSVDVTLQMSESETENLQLNTKKGVTQAVHTLQPIETTASELPRVAQAQNSNLKLERTELYSKVESHTKGTPRQSQAPIDPLLSLSEQSVNAVRTKESLDLPAYFPVAIAVQEAEETVVEHDGKEKTVDLPATTGLSIDKNPESVDVLKTQRFTPARVAEIPKAIVDQIVREVKLVKNVDRSDLLIKLTPPALGTIRLQISQDAAGISTKIVASSDQVKDLLNQHMPNLLRSMNDAGVKIDSLTVTADNNFQSGLFSGFDGFRQAYGREQNSRHNRQPRGHYTDITVQSPRFAAMRNSVNTAYSWTA